MCYAIVVTELKYNVNVSNHNNGLTVTNKSASTFAVRSCNYGYPFTWLSVGKQQWGQYDHGSIVAEMDADIVFPVRFSQCFAISLITLRGNNDDIGAYGSIGTFDVLGFHVHTVQIGYSGSRYIKWMAVGIQQWGKLSGYQVTFPLTFPSIVYFVGGSHIECSNGSGASCVPSDINLNGFTDYTYQNSNQRNWIAIGKQRNGVLKNQQALHGLPSICLYLLLTLIIEFLQQDMETMMHPPLVLLVKINNYLLS